MLMEGALPISHAGQTSHLAPIGTVSSPARDSGASDLTRRSDPSAALEVVEEDGEVFVRSPSRSWRIRGARANDPDGAHDPARRPLGHRYRF